MNELADICGSLDTLRASMFAAVDWLAESALLRTRSLSEAENRIGHQYDDWRGAFRGEYDFRHRRWWFFCPMWHGAQAVKALVHAHLEEPREAWLAAARLGGGFIYRHRIAEGEDKGLLLAYEDHGDRVTISALLETIDGLLALTDATGDPRYGQAAVEAVRWCADKAWLPDQGLVRDLYDPREKRFISRPYPTLPDRDGRPLADDAVWLNIFHRTGDERYRRIFYEVLDRLLRDEAPRGNWSSYGPCHIEEGRIHPRHAYWWGRPLLAAWYDSGQEKWLAAAIRAGDWYRKAQRIDGGIFRDTDLNFNTTSFGQATSGILCAAILWMELFEATHDPVWLEPIHRAMSFGMTMQLRDTDDPLLRGAVLEGTLKPDGTDRCPYFIRDLASIFFVQAASLLLSARPTDTRSIALARRPGRTDLPAISDAGR